jgi:ankyrin repeat protein
MDRRRPLSLAACWTLAIVSGLCVPSLAANTSQTNPEAEQHFQKANELQILADYDAAIAEYQTVISLSPNSKIAQNAQYWIGQLYFESKRFDVALSAFQKLLDEYPASRSIPATNLMIERVLRAKKNRALFEAVKQGDTEQVKSLIAEGADIDAKWVDVYDKNAEAPSAVLIRHGLIDSTPLWHAVDSHNIEMVKLLVEHDPNMNAGSWPPLCLAIDRTDRADTTLVEYLIDHGANVNYPGDWGPLQEAATFSIEKVKLLVARGANVNGGLYQPTIHAGIRSWSREIVEFLIQHGADLNAKDQWGRGYTPLQRAAITGSTDLTKLLLEAGADIDAKDERGQTALQVTLHAPLEARRPDYPPYRLSKDTIELLLAKGADVNLKDQDGRTPLHLAAESADSDIVALLLDKGAEISARDDESGFTALHHAARFGNKNATELLIARGADMNAKDKEGHTPLYIAVNHDYGVAELLINKGADSSIRTESGKTLLELAQQRKQAESTVPDKIFNGDPNSYFGFPIACGDVDGDGYDDILIGAWRYNNRRGRVYLFYGGPDMDTTADVIFEGQNQGDVLGNSIACGDIDNDGYEDIIVGAAGYSEKRGRAYLYWGSDRDSMDANPDKIFVGDEEKLASFGGGYPAVYDIDNDGYGDIILCAYISSDGTGRVYLYYGNTKELMDTSADLIFKPEDAKYTGYTISCGDVDNDGYGDIVVGAHAKQWPVYLYYGANKSNMDAKADVIFKGQSEGNDSFGYGIYGIVCVDQNRDGYDDVVIGAGGDNDKQGRVYLFHGDSKRSMDAHPGMTFDGEVEGSNYGFQEVCGDIDGDKVNDLIIGAHGFRQWVGRVYVYWGNELASPDPKPGRILTGENPKDGYGAGLACGDVNNDGFDDLVIGACGYKAGEERGRVYLYYGGPRNR